MLDDFNFSTHRHIVYLNLIETFHFIIAEHSFVKKPKNFNSI